MNKFSGLFPPLFARLMQINSSGKATATATRVTILIWMLRHGAPRLEASEQPAVGTQAGAAIDFRRSLGFEGTEISHQQRVVY